MFEVRKPTDQSVIARPKAVAISWYNLSICCHITAVSTGRLPHRRLWAAPRNDKPLGGSTERQIGIYHNKMGLPKQALFIRKEELHVEGGAMGAPPVADEAT